jgi:hypothetical protein
MRRAPASPGRRAFHFQRRDGEAYTHGCPLPMPAARPRFRARARRVFVGQTTECSPGRAGLRACQCPGSARHRYRPSLARSRAMSLAVVLSRGLAGLDAPRVTFEVHLGGGLPGFKPAGPARDRGQGVARSRARGALQRRVRMPEPQDHRQSRPGEPAQGIRPLRPADRARRARRERAAPRRTAGTVRVRRRACADGGTAPDPRGAGDGAVRPARPQTRAPRISPVSAARPRRSEHSPSLRPAPTAC